MSEHTSERWTTEDGHKCAALPFLILRDSPPIWWVGFVDGYECCSCCASKEDAKAGCERRLRAIRSGQWV